MKNSKKGVLYAIMAVVGLSGVSARADLKSSFRTATARARDWAGKHKKGIGIGLGALAGAAALSAGTYYGGKTYKQRQAVRPTLTLSEKNISETLVPTTMVAIPDAQEAQAAEPAAEPAAIPPAAIPPAAEPAAIPQAAAIPPAAAAISGAPGAKVADNNRLALLAEIQAGRNLKSVERSKQPKKNREARIFGLMDKRRGALGYKDYDHDNEDDQNDSWPTD